MKKSEYSIPQDFFWRRLHSLAGLWLVIYLFFHLLTNSQAALFIGNDGQGFIQGVNAIHELPYLPLIEIAILAVPFSIHIIWGIKYLLTAKYNSFGAGDGKEPYLPEYPRNRAYTWQRITSWLLIIGIIAHVVHMRIIEYPFSVPQGSERLHMIRVSADEGLYTLSSRIGVTLYDKKQIETLKKEVPVSSYNLKGAEALVAEQTAKQKRNWIESLEKYPLKDGELMAVANNFGAVELLMLRDTFKMPVMVFLYTLLVIASCYHAFNGLWTFMIAWGVTLTERSQRAMRKISNILMIVVAILGLSAIWITYWVNLKH